MRRIAIARIVGVFIAIGGIGVSILCALDAMRENAKLEQARDGRPMEATIDLSQPDETTVPFHQTFSRSHGEVLCVEFDHNIDAEADLDELFAGLFAKVVIKDSDGKEIESLEIDNTSAQVWNDNIMLAYFHPFDEGEYAATIRVESGAAALAGKQQTLYAKYQLCGLEGAIVLIGFAFAFVAGLVGLISARCAFPGLVRHGVWRDTPSARDDRSLSSP